MKYDELYLKIFELLVPSVGHQFFIFMEKLDSFL